MLRSRLTAKITLVIVAVLIVGFGASTAWRRRPLDALQDGGADAPDAGVGRSPQRSVVLRALPARREPPEVSGLSRRGEQGARGRPRRQLHGAGVRGSATTAQQPAADR